MTDQDAEASLFKSINLLRSRLNELENRCDAVAANMIEAGNKAPNEHSPLILNAFQLRLDKMELEQDNVRSELQQACIQTWRNAASPPTVEYPVESSAPVKIELPPGTKLSKLAELLISPKRYERDVQAALADWHAEYFDALDQKRGRVKMAFIRIRYTWAFFKAAGWLLGLETAGKLLSKVIAKFNGA